MADFMTDPFYALANEVEATKTKISDSVFEGYKLSVAQTNDINNRAMQVALSDSTAFADIKAAISAGTLQTMIADSRTSGILGSTAMTTQRLIMEEAERTRELVDGLNTQNLNTALINSNTAIVGGGIGYQGLGLAYGGLGSAVQSVNTSNAVQALQSQAADQSIVNTGAMTASTQTQSPTNIV